jgi:hypothetical protein
MAIGTAAAIGLGVAGVGSALSASSNKKAASKAANVSQQNNTENNALAREIYGKNQQVLSPFMERGNAAGDAINALLGIAPAQTQQTQRTQPNAFSQFVGSPNAFTPFGGAGSPYSLGDYAGLGRDFFDARSYTMSNTLAPTVAQTGVTQPTTEQEILSSADQQNAAFDSFRNSTGYQFRLGEGMDSLNSGFAASGMLQSGARDRAAMEYGQNFASNEFGNYMNALGLQQSVGAGSASSLAGVGQNYASQVINSNNQNAANQANAALVRGNNNVLGNVAGVIGGGLLGGGF